jgi:DNA-binding MarR family transcriptional regulator
MAISKFKHATEDGVLSEVLDLVRGYPRATTKQIAYLNGYSVNTTRKHLRGLLLQGFVVRERSPDCRSEALWSAKENE